MATNIYDAWKKKQPAATGTNTGTPHMTDPNAGGGITASTGSNTGIPHMTNPNYEAGSETPTSIGTSPSADRDAMYHPPTPEEEAAMAETRAKMGTSRDPRLNPAFSNSKSSSIYDAWKKKQQEAAGGTTASGSNTGGWPTGGNAGDSVIAKTEGPKMDTGPMLDEDNDPTTPAGSSGVQPIDPGGEVIPEGSPTAGGPQLPNTPTRSVEKDALIKQLMERMQQGTNVDSTDPNVRRQSDAYSAQEQRARRDFLSESAEAGSPYSTGHQAGLERMTAERMGQRSGQFESELINRELTARRDEIQQALDSMSGLLSDEEKTALEREKANLEASLKWATISNQQNQFYAGLSQDDKQFMQQLGQQDRFKGMDDTFRRMELAQNDAQFNKKLAQEGKIAELNQKLEETKLSQQDKQFLLQLAQSGKFDEMEQEYKRLALGQDNNQFLAKLAQEGKLAEMDDLFRRMKLMQEQSQFLDRLGFDVDDRGSYWDWVSRGGSMN